MGINLFRSSKLPFILLLLLCFTAVPSLYASDCNGTTTTSRKPVIKRRHFPHRNSCPAPQQIFNTNHISVVVPIKDLISLQPALLATFRTWLLTKSNSLNPYLSAPLPGVFDFSFLPTLLPLSLLSWLPRATQSLFLPAELLLANVLTWLAQNPSLIALIVGVLAAWVSITTAVVFPARIRRLEMKLRYVETQLKDLYGPLLAECIRTDSIFRRVHESYSFPDLRDLRTEDFKSSQIYNTSNPTTEEKAKIFAKIVKEVYLEGDRVRAQILKSNMHLLGPYPPTSLFLFLTYASQMEALIKLKEVADLPNRDKGGYLDPYALQPFPFVLAAEVVAKVALLKSYQREYTRRIGNAKLFRKSREIVSRKQYYVLIEGPAVRNDDKARNVEDIGIDNRGHEFRTKLFPDLKEPTHVCPLIYGPYTEIELLELRSWLIFKERPLREMKLKFSLLGEGESSLRNQHDFLVGMLNGEVLRLLKQAKREIGVYRFTIGLRRHSTKLAHPD